MTAALLDLLVWLTPAIPALIGLVFVGFFAKPIVRRLNIDPEKRILLIRVFNFAHYGFTVFAILLIAASFFALLDARDILEGQQGSRPQLFAWEINSAFA